MNSPEKNIKNGDLSCISVLALITLCVAFCVLSGCAASPSESYTTQCVIPNDQTGTISGHWQKTAVQIAFHSGDFSAAEVTTMMTAADTWNTFYNTTRNIAALSYGSRTAPNISGASQPSQVIADSASGDLCSNSIVDTNGNFTGQVVVYKVTNNWYENKPQAIALTSFCPKTITGSNLPYFTQAVTQINYQNFFVAGKYQPDLQSIVLHEFGHVMGLNHSCEANSSASGMPNCNETNLPSDYFNALMFPGFSFPDGTNGQQKRDLYNNDQERANCLYGG